MKYDQKLYVGLLTLFKLLNLENNCPTMNTLIAWSGAFLKTFENMRKLDFFQAVSTSSHAGGTPWCWQPEKI